MTTPPTPDAENKQRQLAHTLKTKIESGELPPGEQLATFDKLATEYGVSLTVVRNAIDALKQLGLLVTHQGKGTFVKEKPVARRHGVSRYSRSVWEGGRAILVAEAEDQGIEAKQVIRELAWVPAPLFVAERFGIEVGTEVWVRRRTTLINERPNQLGDSYYERAVVAGTRIMQEDTGPGGGFKVLEDNGYALERIKEEITLRMPSWPESGLLHLSPGTPIAELTRTLFTTEGKPVEVFRAVIAGDMASFEYDFPIPE
jgi:GntR family transcriptional regulator